MRPSKGIAMPELDDRAAGADAAGIVATTLGGVVGMIATRASTKPDQRGELSASAGTDPVVLHVRDAASGEIDVFRGTTQTRLRDRDLAARIVRTSSRG
jgi:hypothetical protein